MSRRSSESGGAFSKGRKNPYERAIERYDKLREGFVTSTSNLLGALEDDHRPNTGLTLSRRDDGGYMAVIKRMDELENQVMFAYGEDIFDALIKLNGKITKADWKKDKTYAERLAEKEAASK